MSCVLTIAKGLPYDLLVFYTCWYFISPSKTEKGGDFWTLIMFPSQVALGRVCHPKINFAKPCLPLGRERENSFEEA